MPTLNEKFDALWSESEGRNKERMRELFDDDSLHDSFRAAALRWFLAGAKAEREEVLEIIKDEALKAINRTAGTTLIGSMVHEIERRIKERDNA